VRGLRHHLGGPAAEALRVARRDVFLVPGMRGGWEVAEVVRVENPTGAHGGGDGGAPVFGFGVPADATDLQAGEEHPWTAARPPRPETWC
jgi:hypothetical protein